MMALPALAATEPQAVDLGPVKFVPTLGISQTYDDNIFSQPEGVTETWISRVAPEMQFLAQQDANVVAVTYAGDYGFYSSGSDDNYDDHTLSLDGTLEANARNRFNLAGSFARLHDARGTGGSEGVIANSRAEPDEYEATDYTLVYGFGSEDAILGIALTAGATDIEYQNNRSETQFRDREDTNYGIKVSGQLAPKTRTFVEYTQRDIGYAFVPQLRDSQRDAIEVIPGVPLLGTSLDSQEQNISVGAEWEATGKTTGTIKMGRLNKDFDEVTRDDASFINWTAAVMWMPRTYSTLNFTASKAPQETNGTGTFIESMSYGVDWTHDWSSYLHSNVYVGLGNDTFQNDTREDDRETFGASINYDIDSWINVAMGYSFTRRDSNNNLFDFDRNQFMISLDVSL
jgi:hypothetical protein